MTEQKELPPARIWIDWPKKQADDAWYWTHGDYGNVEYVRAQPAENERVREIRRSQERRKLQAQPDVVRPRLSSMFEDIEYLLSLLPVQPVQQPDRVRWLLHQIISDLPKNRDWLDPDIEAEARAVTGVHTVQPAASTPTDDEIDEVQHRADEVVNAAIEWHQSGREGDGSWFDKGEVLGEAIDRLLELREPPNVMPRRYCSVHQREEFKYESLEHELHEADVDKWKRELTKAGWIAESATAWRSPNGGLYRGPYGAWIQLQRQKGMADV